MIFLKECGVLREPEEPADSASSMKCLTLTGKRAEVWGLTFSLFTSESNLACVQFCFAANYWMLKYS